MLIAVAALLLAVVQSPNDTAAIKAAAVDSGENAIGVRVVADTAWVRVVDRRRTIDIPSDGKTTAGTGILAREIRLERRAGKWVKVRPKLLGLSHGLRSRSFRGLSAGARSRCL